MKPIAGICLLILLFASACQKDRFITSPDARISFSADTLYYDTVFTSTGSTTRFVRIYNNNNEKLRLSSVSLASQSGSPFRINVDGFPGAATNLEIQPNDSMYVFVTVTIDPNAENQPFLVRDSLSIRFNGNEQFVQLQAYGQNANFLRNYTVTGNEAWSNEKPYVILNSLTVAENATLTISKGTKLHFHADAPMLIDGSLRVQGEKYDSTKVQFLGDRLDEPYRNFPGAWPGIYFRETSINNLLEYAVVANAYQGVVVDQPASNGLVKLMMNETTITNCFDAGLIANRTSVNSRNCVISNSGKNLRISFGGEYNFDHLTNVANSNSYVAHQDAVLDVSNVFEDGSGIYTADLVARFRNSIFWGNDGLIKDEATFRKEGSNTFDVSLSNSLWKIETIPSFVTSANMITNQDPLFETIDNDKRVYNYRLKEGSPAIEAGAPIGVLTDLDGNPRKANKPDAGAYEKQ
ncbi:MAG: choice-of-anchor Q domain-containing protein [Flavitalea sp.]